MYSINISLTSCTAVRVSKGNPSIKMWRHSQTGQFELGVLTFESPETFELELLKADALNGNKVLGVATPGGSPGEIHLERTGAGRDRTERGAWAEKPMNGNG